MADFGKSLLLGLETGMRLGKAKDEGVKRRDEREWYRQEAEKQAEVNQRAQRELDKEFGRSTTDGGEASAPAGQKPGMGAAIKEFLGFGPAVPRPPSGDGSLLRSLLGVDGVDSADQTAAPLSGDLGQALAPGDMTAAAMLRQGSLPMLAARGGGAPAVPAVASTQGGGWTPREPPPEYLAWAQEAAKAHNLDYRDVLAMAAAESQYNPSAVSRAGARGVMQIMPSTWKGEALGTNIDDPRENIFGGTKYYAQLMQQFGNDRDKAIMAYNAGPTAMASGKALGYPETQQYLQRVQQARRLFGEKYPQV